MLKRILRRTLLVLVGNGVSKLLLVGFELFLAMRLGSAGYGLYAICLTVVLVASNLSLLGLNFALVQYLAILQEEGRLERARRLIRLGLLAIAVPSTVVGLAVWAQSDWLAERLFSKPHLARGLALAGLAIPFECLNQGMSAVFKGLRRFRSHVLVADLVRNGILVASIPLLFRDAASFETVVLVLLGGSAAGSAVGALGLSRWLFGRGPRGESRLPLVREVAAFAAPLLLWNLFQKIAGRLQLLLAGIFLIESDVGVLGILLRVVLLLTFLQSAVNHTAPVEFVRLVHLQEWGRLRPLFRSLSQALLLTACVLAVPFTVGPAFVLGLVGEDYGSHAWLLIPMLFAQVVNVGTGPVGQLLIAARRQPLILRVSVIGSLVQVVLSVLLMPMLGLLGAAISETATILTMTGLRHAYSFRHLAIHGFSPTFLRVVSGWLIAIGAGRVLGVLAPGAFGFLAGSLLAGAILAGTMGLAALHDDLLRSRLEAFRARLLEPNRARGQSG